MNAEQLREWINSLTQDIDFVYEGVQGSICPFSRNNISLCYGGDEITVASVDEAMATPFIRGRSLNEVCGNISI